MNSSNVESSFENANHRSALWKEIDVAIVWFEDRKALVILGIFVSDRFMRYDCDLIVSSFGTSYDGFNPCRTIAKAQKEER